MRKPVAVRSRSYEMGNLCALLRVEHLVHLLECRPNDTRGLSEFFANLCLGAHEPGCVELVATHDLTHLLAECSRIDV